MKKLVSLLIAGSMAAAICPCTGFAAEGESTAATTTGSFTYTENFDSMADGSLPAGWTLYRNKTSYDWRTIDAQVKNGALEISENNKDGKGGYLIFDTAGFADVKSKDLTMECDITLGNSLGVQLRDSTADDCVGFTYAFDESRIDAAAIENVNGVKVVDGGVPETSAFRVRMYTNKGEDTTYQTLLNEKCNQKSLYRANQVTSTENKINTAGTEQKMKLKIAVTDVNRYATIYLNGTEIANSYGNRTDPDRTSGKIGLFIKNAAVTIDNIKITGTSTYPDITTYKASFKTAGAKYESIEAAKADVVVAECDYFGNMKTDVTAGATITSTDNGDVTGTVSVTYGDYSTTLSFSILSKETRSFVYEENFDTMADGSLPEGWTLYQNSTTSGKTIKAQVKNGAMEITENNQYGRGGYLIFDIPELADVNSQDLTMECDITLGNSLGITCANAADDNVGFAYVFDESKITGAIDNSTGVNVVAGGVDYAAAFRVRMFTNKANDDKGAEIVNQILMSDKQNQNNESRSHEITSNVKKINTAETAQTMKLKIAVTDTNYCPTIYLDGTEVKCTDQYDYINPYRTNGKLGLYIKDTAVTIDNIKITGTKKDFAPDADSLAISSLKYDSANSKLNVTADASLTTAAVSANSKIIAAVYDDSNNLVTVKTVDASNVADYHGTITLDGVSSAPTAGKVKLFCWDMSSIKPIANSAVK